jgi:DNA-binding MarR family transcriptional regulator
VTAVVTVAAQIGAGVAAEDGDEAVSDADFAELLRFRDALRQFLHWSEGEARAAGLTPAQHQLLLAIRGHGGDPTIGDVADHLMLRHHSAVELADRAERAGLVHRRADPDDHRVVRLALSRDGARHLAALSAAHVAELHRLQHGLRLPSLAG